MLYKNDRGEKMYPIGSYEKEEHKLYNEKNRIENELDSLYISNINNELINQLEKRLMDVIELLEEIVNINGVAYATYKYYKLSKDIICSYNLRNNI